MSLIYPGKSKLLAGSTLALGPALALGLPLSLGLALSLGLTGCAVGQVVDRAVEPQLNASEGMIALAVDTNCELGVTLCLDADLGSCANFGALHAKHLIEVQRVPAGQYCLMQMDVTAPDGATGFSDTIEERDVRCFDVGPGRIAYPGHLVYLVKPTQSSYERVSSGWDKREQFAEKLHAAYPKLARWPVDVAKLHNKRTR